jgi:hypothetical protein
MNYNNKDACISLRTARQLLNHGIESVRIAIINTTALFKSTFFLGVMAFLLMPIASYGVAVTTQHNNNYRTGQNDQETILNVSNVNVNSFGKLYSYNFATLFNVPSSYITWQTQALYVPNVKIPQKGVHNVLYICSSSVSCYAIDADVNSTPLWRTSIASGVLSVPSTPVIDAASNTMYVVGVTNDGLLHFKLHALDITTGNEKPNSPVEIQGSVFGNGTASVNGILTFDPANHSQKPGLLLLNGNIYIAFGGKGDLVNAHGWIFSYSAKDLQFKSVVSTSPNMNLTSIWYNNGIAADDRGFIYVHTGNNVCGLTKGLYLNCALVGDYSNSVLKIDTSNNGLNIVDHFTPSSQNLLNIYDIDLSSSGPLIIPGTSIGTGGGKGGSLYVWNTNGLGGYSPILDQVLQNLKLTMNPLNHLADPKYWANYGFWGGNVYYDASSRFERPGKTTIYSGTRKGIFFAWAKSDYLRSVNFNDQSLDQFNIGQGQAYAPRGAAMSISSNGIIQGSSILWAYANDASNTTGIVRAYDVSNISNILWDSSQNSGRDGLVASCKNPGIGIPPTVVSGKVYVPDSCGNVSVYGLLPK